MLGELAIKYRHVVSWRGRKNVFLVLFIYSFEIDIKIFSFSVILIISINWRVHVGVSDREAENMEMSDWNC